MNTYYLFSRPEHNVDRGTIVCAGAFSMTPDLWADVVARLHVIFGASVPREYDLSFMLCDESEIEHVRQEHEFDVFTWDLEDEISASVPNILKGSVDECARVLIHSLGDVELLYDRVDWVFDAVDEEDDTASITNLRAHIDNLRAGIEDIRDEAWESWVEKDWQHLDRVRDQCNELLNSTQEKS